MACKDLAGEVFSKRTVRTWLWFDVERENEALPGKD